MITLFLKKDKGQDKNVNQLKFDLHDTSKNFEKTTIDFEPMLNEEVTINKGCLDEKLLKLNGHFSFLEKQYNAFTLQYKNHL